MPCLLWCRVHQSACSVCAAHVLSSPLCAVLQRGSGCFCCLAASCWLRAQDVQLSMHASQGPGTELSAWLVILVSCSTSHHHQQCMLGAVVLGLVLPQWQLPARAVRALQPQACVLLHTAYAARLCLVCMCMRRLEEDCGSVAQVGCAKGVSVLWGVMAGVVVAVHAVYCASCYLGGPGSCGCSWLGVCAA